jgi:hypothetical protein
VASSIQRNGSNNIVLINQGGKFLIPFNVTPPFLQAIFQKLKIGNGKSRFKITGLMIKLIY